MINLYDIHPDPKNAPYADVAFEKVPELVWQRYRKQPDELKKREKVLAKDAHYAYQYANEVLKGPFPAGEAGIAKDTELAFDYANQILKGPFPKGEAAIAKDPELAYNYARYILEKPFPAGEVAIAKNEFYARQYARKVLWLPDNEAWVWPKKLKENQLKLTFKTFLAEAKYRQDISLERAKELIEAHCQDALKHLDTPLVRGMKNREEAYLIQGEVGGRESKNSSNHYTIILDELLPSLGYPRRSASIILGNYLNLEYVRSYGRAYAILPFDGVKIGVVPEEDIWHTRIKLGKYAHPRSLENWNDFFEKAGTPDYTFEDMVTYLEEVLEDFEDKNHTRVDEVFTKGKVEEQLRTAYSPKATRFELTTPAEVYTRFDDIPRELWVGGKCVVIELCAFRKLFGVEHEDEDNVC